MGQTILLTGRPGTGKTTIIRRIVTALSREAGGFYTQEIRDGRQRRGFRIVTLDGHEGILAHVNIKGHPRIGKYGVDLAALETIGVASIREAVARGALVVIDEIGPMEILSEPFRRAVLAAIESESPVLGTVVKRREPFADKIKALPDVTVLDVTVENRDAMAERALDLLAKSHED